MRKDHCKVVLDLMPLVLDRVASDESRRIVEEHIACCAECRKQYDKMKADMPTGIRIEYEKEQRDFIAAIRAVREKRLKRQILAVSLAVILCLAAAFAGMFAYDLLFNRMSVVVENELYTMNLSKLADGRIVVTADASGIDFGTITCSEEYVTDGRHVIYIHFLTTPIRHDGFNMPSESAKWCMYILPDGSENELHEIRQGNLDQSQTIWSQGDPIPAASEEMEEYFALQDQIASWQDEGEYHIWHKRVEEVRSAVPEWK